MASHDLKRKAESSGSCAAKIPKYNSLISLIQELECNEESAEIFESLLKLNDVDYFEPTEQWTPLCCALHKQKHGWIKLLLQKGADPTFATIISGKSEQNVSDFLWSIEDYHTVITLVLLDYQFPKDYDENKLSACELERKTKFITKNQSLKKSIKNGHYDEVENFTEMNYRIRHAYDEQNQCALTVALKFRQFKIYSFLRSKGFAKGNDTKHDEVMESLKKSDKQELEQEIRKYFKSTDIYIMNLLAKSYLGMNNNTKHFETVKECFEQLNALDDIRPILQLAASDSTMTITFDFNSDDIEDLDVTHIFSDNYKVGGRSFKKSKKILIAAGQKEKLELLGTLAQELTHLVLEMVYKNHFLPYFKDNKGKELEYARVFEACDRVKNQEKIIESAFMYEENKKAELIARVPQLLVVYENQQKELERVQEIFSELFAFFKLSVSKDIQHQVCLIKPKKKVQELNNILGVFHSMKTATFYGQNLDPSSKILCSKLQEPENVFVASRLPELILSTLVKTSVLYDSEHIIIKLNQLIIQQNMSSVNDIFEMKFFPKLFIIDSIEVECLNAVTVLNEITNGTDGKLVFVSNRKFKTLKEQFEHCFEFNFKWDELSERSKSVVFGSEINFQGLQIRLKDLFDNNKEALKNLPLEELVEAKKLRFHSSKMFLPETRKPFVRRFFKLPLSNETLEADDILSKIDDEKTVIIADVAGMGKTTSAISFVKMLERRQPVSWVVFLDLKQHTKSFSPDENKKIQKFNFDDLMAKLLNLKIKTEDHLFKFFFENKKCIFVVDGFDEISPLFKKFVFKILLHVQSSKNCLLVTTRMHLKEELEETLKTKAISLMPFTEQDQIDFIIERLQMKSKNMPKTKLEKKAKSIIKKVAVKLNQKQIFLSIPLQLFMFSKVFDVRGFMKRDLNIFTLYQHFVDSKISIWMKEKGQLASDDDRQIHNSEFNVSLIHQSIATNIFYGDSICRILEPINKETICRIGLMQSDQDGEVRFQHETFADFFLVRSLMQSLTTKTYSETFEVSHDRLIEVLVENSYYHDNIRNFINARLMDEDEIYHKKLFSEKLEAMLTVESNRLFLIRLIEAKHYGILRFVLIKLSLSEDTKVKVVKHVNVLNCNSLHVAAVCVETWTNLWECIESFTDESTRKELLLIKTGYEEKDILQRSKTEKTNVYKCILETYRKVWNTKTKTRGFSAIEPPKSNLIEKKLLAFEILLKSIEENFDVQFQKELLFKNTESTGLFYDLSNNPESLKIALRSVKRLFNPNELNAFVTTDDWLKNIQIQYASDSPVITTIQKFLQKNLKSVKEDSIISDFLKIEVVGSSMERASEAWIFNRILSVLGNLIEIQDGNTNRSDKNLKWLVQILVHLAIHSTVEYYSKMWEFIEQKVDSDDRKKLMILKYESHNILTGVIQNEQASLMYYVYSKLNSLLAEEDFVDFAESSIKNCVVEVLVEYARSANVEAFDMFWSLLEKKGKNYQKSILLEKKRRGYDALCASAENKNISTVSRILTIAEDLLQEEDYLAGRTKTSKHRWVLRMAVQYARKAEFEAFQIFWEFIKTKVVNDDQKQMLSGCAGNKDFKTVEYVINIAIRFLSSYDYFDANEPEHQEWALNAACSFAKKAELGAFKMFWSLAVEKLNQANPKLILLKGKPSGFNVLQSCIRNKDTSTILFIFEKARELLTADDFNVSNQSWIVGTLFQYATSARLEVFKIFWDFLHENLTEKDRKTSLIQKTIKNRSILPFLSRNKDKSTVITVLNEAKDLITEAMILDTLNQFARMAKFVNFETAWDFFNENFTEHNKKSLMLGKNKNGSNVFMSSAKNKDEKTIKHILDIASGLFTKEDLSKELQSEKEKNWLVNTCSRYCTYSKLNVFNKFWSFVENIFDTDQQKILLWTGLNHRGSTSVMSMVNNKDIKTIEKVFDIVGKLLSTDDFFGDMQDTNFNLLVKVSCRYAARAKLEAFEFFWDFVKEIMERKEQKLVLLQKNTKKGCNALKSSAKNKNQETVEKVLNVARSLVSSKDFIEDIKNGTKSWVVNSLNYYAFHANNETFLLIWNFITDKCKEGKIDQKAIFLQKDESGDNVLMASAHNTNTPTILLIFKIAESLLVPEKTLIAVDISNQNWLVETCIAFAAFAELENFKVFWSFMEQNVVNADFKSIFLEKNDNGSNALMSSAENKNKTTVALVLEIAKPFLNSSDYQDYSFFVYWFNHLYDDFKCDITFSTEQIRNFLLKNYYGYNIVCCITFVGDPINNLPLWNIVLNHLEPLEIKDKLVAKDENGDDAFSNAVLNNRQIVLSFLEWYKNNSSLPELRSIFDAQNNESETLVHFLASTCDKRLCREVNNFMSASFSGKEIETMLLVPNSKGLNPLQTSEKNDKTKKAFAEFFQSLDLP